MRATLFSSLVFVASILSSPSLALADAIPVTLQKTESGWQLLRDGEPYQIRGSGGGSVESLQALADAGGNSVRTWAADGIDEILDEAHRLGLTVTVGIWLGHERHGFDYSDPAQVREQLEKARQAVLRYKDHPAVLLWGIGNEAEGFKSGDDPRIWAAVNDVAAMIKELDPNYPTMTVTAEIGGGRIDSLHRRSPAIDIHGINAYGGSGSLFERLQAGGATKPYVVTEFGPIGPWEAAKTQWGAPYEQTSTEKAAFYRASYEKNQNGATGYALGSYAFLWGHKMEGTATWFGMFLDNGARLGVVDAMSELWSGEPPDDLAPRVEPLTVDGDVQLDRGDEVVVNATAIDPEGGALRGEWVLRTESGDYATGGDFRAALPHVEDAIIDSNVNSARVRMPDQPGAYRLFYTVYDAAGNAATANVPLLVKGKVGTRFPVAVYTDGLEGMPWAPSGWMGSHESLTLDGDQSEIVFAGEASVKMRYEGPFGWVGVAWQNPPNNWGEVDGGFDLTGAKELEFWARGEYGGEKIAVGVGIIDSDKAFPDSGKTPQESIELSGDWTRYTISLKRIDLSSIKTGFVVTITGRSSPVTVYLDNIRFIR